MVGFERLSPRHLAAAVIGEELVADDVSPARRKVALDVLKIRGFVLELYVVVGKRREDEFVLPVGVKGAAVFVEKLDTGAISLKFIDESLKAHPVKLDGIDADVGLPDQ